VIYEKWNLKLITIINLLHQYRDRRSDTFEHTYLHENEQLKIFATALRGDTRV